MSPSLEEEVKLLSMVDILQPLSDEELEELAHRCPDRHIDEGEFLYTPSDPNERLFVLKRGKVRIYRVAEGSELTLAMVDEGTVFGEMALTGQHLREAHAQAMEPSLVLSMGRADLEHFISENPKVGLLVAQLLSERLRLYENRLEDLTLKQVPARLASLLLLLSEGEGVMTADKQIKIPTHYTHERLGTMIGANRVAVTRAFGYLQNLGAVEVLRRRIYLADTGALKRTADGTGGQATP
jgi:CRP/FNR family transcriptional regulator, cyclic AMP receptor protein